MNEFNVIESEFSGHTLIEASAGTGKTYTLAFLYVRLLLERSLSVRQILVVTFTKAATAELRSRIRSYLTALLALYDENSANIGKIDANLQDLWHKFPQIEHKNRLILAIHGFDEAAIYTIHGFCQRALSESAFEAGSDFSNELLHDDADLVSELVFDFWRIRSVNFSYLWSDFLVNQQVNPHNLYVDIAVHLGKPYLKLEPKLTKFKEISDLKTWQTARNLWFADRESYLAQLQNFPGFSKIYIKENSLNNWFADVDALFSDEKPTFSYVESLGKIARNHLTKACKKNFVLPVSRLADVLQELTDEMTQIMQQFAAQLAQFKVELINYVNKELPKVKAQKRVLSFDDLINKLASALSGKNGKQLAQSIRERFPLALIDEFQDTDPAQYQIFSTIYQACNHDDLCLVGDPKQAIYAFRSADFVTYVKARSLVHKRYSLVTNYRTGHNLINALNHLFATNSPFADDNLQYMQAKAADLSTRKLVLADEFGKSALTIMRLSDDYLTASEATDKAAKSTALIIARILQQAKEGKAYFVDEQGTRTPVISSDIAVLVNSHKQAKLVGDYLTDLGVDWVRQAKDSVFASDEASELASVLAAYLEPSNEGLLRYALTSSFLGKSAADIFDLNQDLASFEHEVSNAYRYADLWQTHGFLRMFRTMLSEQQIASRLLALKDGERKLTNLLHLAQLLQDEAVIIKEPRALLLWFNQQRMDALVYAGHESHELRLESDAMRVTISTIHAAKGLEYSLVFCPFLWLSKLPDIKKPLSLHDEDGNPLVDFGGHNKQQNYQIAQDEFFAEKMRVLYVALTRAKDRLWISWSAANCKPKQTVKNGLHTSSLGWLLHGRKLDASNGVANLQAHIKQREITELNQDLISLVEQSGSAIDLITADYDAQNIIEPAAAYDDLSVAAFTRTLHKDWQISSFTQLAKHVSHSLPQLIGSGIFAFTKGANAGNCLHHILEDWAKGQILTLEHVRYILTLYNFDADEFGDLIFHHMQQVLAAELLPNLSLQHIAQQQRFAELDFVFSVQNLTAENLSSLLANPRFKVNPVFIDAAQHLDFAEVNGFMRGFIDLTFCHQNTWYIADYKSNWLGPDVSYYQEDELIKAMAREHYYLQYLIYSLALQRFLRLHNLRFGGVFYLFIRALPNAGIYFDLPHPDLLQALDELCADDKSR